MAAEEPAPAAAGSPTASIPNSPTRPTCPAWVSAADADVADEYRLRFLNFNMANSSSFGSVSGLMGPGGRGSFDVTFNEPFPDGGMVDLAFVTLVETRLALSDWLHQQSARREGPLDTAISTNAARQGNKEAGAWQVQGWLESLAANYNGNLKSVLAFSSSRFQEDPSLVLHGRLTETRLAGFSVPNPKKAFVGRTLVEAGHGFRLCFVGAHFPICKVAEALEDPPYAGSLHGAKISLARTLRKVLRKAHKRKILDGETLLILQGDVNSRTVLNSDKSCSDVLQECLRDEGFQNAMQAKLPGLAPGRWHELPCYDRCQDLPVTYKYMDRPGYAFERSADDMASRGKMVLTVGDVLTATGAPADGNEGPEIYRKVLQGVPAEQLKAWGVIFKENEFRPFRFPACADRVIYWAPKALSSRLSWTVHRGGYQVNQLEKGSDHRPVSLEVTLRLTRNLPSKGNGSSHPASPTGSDTLAPSSPLSSLPPQHDAVVREVSQVDTDDSDSEVLMERTKADR